MRHHAVVFNAAAAKLMMSLKTRSQQHLEQTLGESLLSVASELRLIDAADFIAFIRTGQLANLRTLVQSSTELHFRPGTLRLSAIGEVHLTWHRPPLIILPMEFRQGQVRAHFRLRLASCLAAVEIDSFAIGDATVDPDDANLRFSRALDEARINGAA